MTDTDPIRQFSNVLGPGCISTHSIKTGHVFGDREAQVVHTVSFKQPVKVNDRLKYTLAVCKSKQYLRTGL